MPSSAKIKRGIGLILAAVLLYGTVTVLFMYQMGTPFLAIGTLLMLTGLAAFLTGLALTFWGLFTD